MKRLAALAALAAASVIGGEAAGDSLIAIKTGVPWSETSGDDLARLKSLALNVGWEFNPNAEINQKLKDVGIRYIRCINVDALNGHYEKDGSFAVEGGGATARLDAHLKTCREIGANPHICFNIHVPKKLQVDAKSAEKELGLMGQQAGRVGFWNGDWAKFKAHAKAYFDYVIVKNGFAEARFEVGNEPDINGQGFMLPGPKLANGSAKLYKEYFDVYKNTAEAAAEFEKERGAKIKLGGPALAWAFTFRYGSFNWADKFLRDCATQKLKLDFIGLHFYGNISSLQGGYKASFPTYVEMLSQTAKTRDEAMPGVPFIFTEWGPSYTTDTSESAVVNADNVGAAWSMEFLSVMLSQDIREAIYLVTTDLSKPDKANPKISSDVWGWPSLFLNPRVYEGKTIPKPVFHLMKMISKLEGARVESVRVGNVGSFVAAQKESRTLRALVWNCNVRIPEKGAAVEMGSTEAAQINVRDAKAFFGGAKKVKAVRSLISGESGNDAIKIARGEKGLAQLNCEIPAETSLLNLEGEELNCCFALPPSSVSLVEMTAEP